MPAKLPAIELKWTSEFEDYLRKEKKIQDEDTKNPTRASSKSA